MKRIPKNEFIAQFETSEQYTEQNWRVRTPTMNVTENTTIKELLNWYRLTEKVGHMEIKIIQTEKVE